MKKHTRILFVLSPLIVLLLLSGCKAKSAKLQSSSVPADSTLFENGNHWMDKSQYLKSRLAFQTLINTYPDSQFAPKALFAIADSYYKEGGREALLQAEAQYKDFMVFYPTHEKTAEAQLKIAALNMRMMEAPDRDKTYAKKAELELKNFIDQFPKHKLLPEAKAQLREVQEVLARGVYGVGQFYYKRKSYNAAISRLQEVAQSYPNFSEVDNAYFLLADALEKQDRADEAVVYYAKIAQGYPSSSKFEIAKDRLSQLEKPVPTVDLAFAADHEKNKRKEEKFAFLRNPIKEMKGIFTGGPDPFEQAVKSAEARVDQAQVEKEEGITVRAKEGGIQVVTEIKKGPTDEGTVKTVINDQASPPAEEAGPKSEQSDGQGTKDKNKKKGLIKRILRRN